MRSSGRCSIIGLAALMMLFSKMISAEAYSHFYRSVITHQDAGSPRDLASDGYDFIFSDVDHSALTPFTPKEGRIKTPQLTVQDQPYGLIRNNYAPHEFLFSKPGCACQYPAEFIVSNLKGQILVYNKQADSTTALVVADRSAEGASYTGMALSNHKLFVANNIQNGTIDVFDHTFTYLHSIQTPNIPAEYGPYNIVKFPGHQKFYVTFVKLDSDGNVVFGAGLGYVVAFDKNGENPQTLISQGKLNAPFGIEIIKQNFGKPEGQGLCLVIGNRGDGRLNVYNATTGEFLKQLTDGASSPIEVGNLRAIKFKTINKRPFLFFISGSGALGYIAYIQYKPSEV